MNFLSKNLIFLYVFFKALITKLNQITKNTQMSKMNLISQIINYNNKYYILTNFKELTYFWSYFNFIINSIYQDSTSHISHITASTD